MQKPWEGSNLHLVLGYPIAPPRFITQDFGNVLIIDGENVYARWELRGHPGLDFRAKVGTEVLTCDEGIIARTRDDPNGFGIYVCIRHEWGFSYYCHMSTKYNSGLKVKKGDIIGYSGNSGFSTAPHLHFGISIDGCRLPGFGRWAPPQYYFEDEEQLYLQGGVR